MARKAQAIQVFVIFKNMVFVPALDLVITQFPKIMETPALARLKRCPVVLLRSNIQGDDKRMK